MEVFAVISCTSSPLIQPGLSRLLSSYFSGPTLWLSWRKNNNFQSNLKGVLVIWWPYDIMIIVNDNWTICKKRTQSENEIYSGLWSKFNIKIFGWKWFPIFFPSQGQTRRHVSDEISSQSLQVYLISIQRETKKTSFGFLALISAF